MPQLKRNRYYQSFEFMFILSKGEQACNYITVPCNSAGRVIISKEGRRRPKGYRFRNNNVGSQVKDRKIKGNIWLYHPSNTKDKSAYQHPAIFPEALARDHIISWSNPGAIILDPFMGSGTTAKMAIETDRHYLGFEISQRYVDLANKRIKSARVPLPGINV